MTLSWEKVSDFQLLIVTTAHEFDLGQGLIILLSGPPGTGKTLTAEAGKSFLSSFFPMGETR
jgi:SpoVK/Ycf46/Vps4 family AAA+-type ATPase